MKPALAHKLSPAEVIQEKIAQSGLLESVGNEQLSAFTQQSLLKNYHKGSLLFAQGDAATSFYLVVKGWVKLFRETLDGEEAVVDVLTAGHLVGETVIFEGEHYGMNAEVVEDAEIIVLPLSLLKRGIEESPQISLNMLKAMSRFRRQQDMEIEHRALQSAPQRIGCFLLRLCKPNAAGAQRINLPYDKTLIASRLGMKPETFSRGLARLREETGIRIQGATVELNSLEQLSGYSCSACSSTYPCKDI